ncbi:MAG: transcription antitermination factor NusB [Myxococcota bacterium]
MGSRRRARELALQTLYSLEFGERTVEEVLADMRERASEPPHPEDEDLEQLIRGDTEVQDFAETLVRGVVAHRDGIDTLLGRCSTNWKVPRMAVVDRNILRMATYELRWMPDIPPKVTLNEAVEIAKRYGSQDSGAFINGILDRIASLPRDDA